MNICSWITTFPSIPTEQCEETLLPKSWFPLTALEACWNEKDPSDPLLLSKFGPARRNHDGNADHIPRSERFSGGPQWNQHLPELATPHGYTTLSILTSKRQVNSQQSILTLGWAWNLTLRRKTWPDGRRRIYLPGVTKIKYRLAELVILCAVCSNHTLIESPSDFVV